MLRQAIAALNDRAAAVAKCAACPQATPSTVLENLRGSGVSLVESRNDALAWQKRFVSGKTTGDGAIEEGFLERVLEAAADSDALQLAHVEHQFCAFGARGVEVDGDKDAADRNFVVLETVVTRVQVGIQFHAHTWVQFLRPWRGRPASRWVKFALCSLGFRMELERKPAGES